MGISVDSIWSQAQRLTVNKRSNIAQGRDKVRT
jgi:hypothetical protein